MSFEQHRREVFLSRTTCDLDICQALVDIALAVEVVDGKPRFPVTQAHADYLYSAAARAEREHRARCADSRERLRARAVVGADHG